MTGAGANSRKNIALVGCGNMGGAMLLGWLDSEFDADYLIVQPRAPKPEFAGNAIRHADTPEQAADFLRQADIVILAVKPQIMEEVCKTLQPYVPLETLIMSVAAGRPLSSFTAIFGESQPVVRALPNLAASVGESLTVAVASRDVRPDQRALANELLACIGPLRWIENEDRLHALSAVAASGTGFLGCFMEAFGKAGEAAGLTAEEAAALVRQVVIGTGAYLKAQPDLDAATMREKVTSPKGMTEAGLKQMMDGRLQKVMEETVKAAAARSRELGQKS